MINPAESFPRIGDSYIHQLRYVDGSAAEVRFTFVLVRIENDSAVDSLVLRGGNQITDGQ